jgi:integrase
MSQWLAQKAAQGLSWSTRCDLRNILSGIFTKAMDWGYHIDRNPVERVAVGRRRMAREHRKLTDDQIRALLAALHPDVRLIVTMALLSALRISEVLGLQWQDVDLERRIVYVRRRWYRGELDWVKSARSERPVPLPEVIAQELERVPPGDRKPDEFVFGVRTAHGTICRDDRDINQHFLRPVAKALGIYYPGFGFHAFRREAITHLARLLDPFQAQRMAGHTHPRMTAWYTLLDVEGQRRAQEHLQTLVIPDGENLAKPA